MGELGFITETMMKTAQLLKDAFPDLTTTAVFWDQSSADQPCCKIACPERYRTP
jgi:hypothetical protein